MRPETRIGYIFLSIPSLVVESSTVSSIMTNTCSHDRNPSGGQPCLIICIIVFTYMTKSTHDVGEPCRTPTVVAIKAVRVTLFIYLYIAAKANSIVAIHPICFRHVNKFILGTQSCARQKSTNFTNNFHFFLLVTSINNLSVSICSVQPRPAWLPACSRYGMNHLLSRAHNTMSYTLARLLNQTLTVIQVLHCLAHT